MPPGGRSKIGLRLALAATLMAVAPAAGSQSPKDAAPLEYAVKATYLYKFAPFVSWRSGASGPFNICIVGADPFGPVIENAVAGQRIGRRPVIVRRVPIAAKGMGCQVLYFGGAPDQTAGEALAAVRGEPVLTVTDAARNPDASGMIHFWVSGGRVRFEINSAAATAAGLSISSKLLALNAKAPKGRS